MFDLKQRAEQWLLPTFDASTQSKVKNLLKNDLKTLEDAFHKDLEFGTGGMRGIMGVGTNRINKYTLGKSTQGLANYLQKSYPDEPIKVVIAYDCRYNSNTLAKVVSEVFSANCIQVYLFSELRPTPSLSFAVKYLKCHAGIVLTASHNPPEYNGYKVYWTDSGQIVPPQDNEIINEINTLDFQDIKFKGSNAPIKYIDKKVDTAFINASIKNATLEAPNRSNLNIVFSTLHGTAITILPQTLKQAGYSNVHIVEEQATPDGGFPTVKSPNPEETEALTMAIEKANKLNADIVIATDPDADRLGIAVRDLSDNLVLLNGNQTMIVMTKFLLEKWKKNEKLQGKEFIASTIVSTPMIKVLGKAYDTECKLGLTGFKWIAKMIKDYPKLKFIGGGEESFGYLVGDFVRDKDAITSALLACEIATKAKSKNSSFFKELLKCYVDYGFYKEHLVSITKKGIKGIEKIQTIMSQFRDEGLEYIDKSKVSWVDDYKSSISKHRQTGKEKNITLPKSNVLIFNTEDGTRLAIRPSGTEPKIKLYISVNDTLNHIEKWKIKDDELSSKISRIIAEINL